MLTFWQALRSWFCLNVVRGDRLLILVVLALGLSVSSLTVAWGHDRYDCMAAGEGTAQECQQHEWRHAHSTVGPWVLIVAVHLGYDKQARAIFRYDMAGTFETFDACFRALKRFGTPVITEAGAAAGNSTCQ